MRLVRRAVVLFCLSGMLASEEIHGKVTQVDGDSAVVRLDGDLLPIVGDKVEVYYKLPGADDTCHVAGGIVAVVRDDRIAVKLDGDAAQAKAGFLVRITSASPHKREPAETGDRQAGDPRNAGERALAKGDFQGAEEAFSQGLRSDPKDIALHLGRAWARRGLGRPNEALTDLEECLRLEPHHRGAGYLRALCRAALGEDPRTEIGKMEEELTEEISILKPDAPLARSKRYDRACLRLATVEFREARGEDPVDETKGALEDLEAALGGGSPPVESDALAPRRELKGALERLARSPSLLQQRKEIQATLSRLDGSSR